MRRFQGSELLVATHNAGKLEEIAALLRPLQVGVISAGALGLPEPEETETSFVGNARLKAHAAAQAAGRIALADDSGLSIDALGGAPGVYTADWAMTETGRNFDVAMRRAWAEVEAVAAAYPRKAQFNCTLVLAWPDGHDEVFAGVVPGQLVWPMRGDKGHGFDPMFQPDGYAQTFAEMDRWEKNRISHRGRAFEKMLQAFA